VVNSPTLLAGVARCGYCGTAMIQNTGKGTYRYYCCSRKLKEGALACRGMRIRMDRLDDIVTGELAKRILRPERLRELLERYLRTASDRQDLNRERLAKLRQAHKDAEAAITRLLGLVEKGLMDVEDPNLRERLIGLRLQRDELASDIAALQKRLASGEPVITEDKIDRLAALLRDKLYGGSPELRQAYARLMLREVTVREGEIRISGSKAVLARAAAQSIGQTPPAVLSFVREWRAGRDSNLLSGLNAMHVCLPGLALRKPPVRSRPTSAIPQRSFR
jgi:site-specific DNA recombinase